MMHLRPTRYVVRWHGAGFRSATVLLEIRRLIREMSVFNPLWRAPRIHGELLKLGIDVGKTSVAEYMARRRGPPCRDGRRSFVIMLTGSL
jgi:hypothetical protein